MQELLLNVEVLSYKRNNWNVDTCLTARQVQLHADLRSSTNNSVQYK